MSEILDEGIGDDLRVNHKLGIRVKSIIEDYTSDDPYRLVWRFDFDESLISVCNINGENYDKNNLSDEDIENIEMDYMYLKNTATFIKDSGICGNSAKVLDDGSAYIDFVNEGWPNSDGKTYSYREYLLTEKGNRLDLCAGEDAELSDDGFFTFDDIEIPCKTRVFEDGVEMYDYRESS